ncbi:MAG TPA: nuclear transport factor 2 family protein [Candidatus Acidoferrales bacterium]|nr:nuclear transport factor 2 family protein [Candidatus Acidoferrales bacterium]
MNMSRIPGYALVTRLSPLLLAAALLASPVAHAQQGPRSGQSTAARVQRLEDIEEIRNPLIDYGRDLDAHDLAAYSHLFAKDGEWVGGFGLAKGPAAIQAMMEKNLDVTSKNKPGSTYHLLTNFRIDVHGDTATAWSRWSFTVTTADNKPAILYGGHYDDTLVREDGVWKFQRRVAVNDIPQAAPTETK